MEPNSHPARLILRATAIWLVLIVAEILHGIARGILLAPYVGEFRSNQIGVFTGSIIIVTFGFVFVQAFRRKVPWKVTLPFAINLVANVIFTPIQFGMRNFVWVSIATVLQVSITWRNWGG
jgi:hypothetical protein